MNKKLIIETNLGPLEVKNNELEGYAGITIKLNGVPVALLEEVQREGEIKIVLKKYHNNKVVQDDNYINFDIYDL